MARLGRAAAAGFGLWLLFTVFWISIQPPEVRAYLAEIYVREPLRLLVLPYRIARFAAEPPDPEIQVPVRGVRKEDIPDSWGAPRGESRSHEGQDIFARRGELVFAAAPGYVVRMAERGIGGKHIFILARGGERHYYAHLDDFAPGLSAWDFVGTSTVLGFVGTSGNAEGGPPHLHFGIYAPDGPADPLPRFAEE